MLIVSAQNIFVRQVDQRVSRTGVSSVPLDHYFTGDEWLSPANIDRPEVVIAGLDPAVCRNMANFHDIAPPVCCQRPTNDPKLAPKTPLTKRLIARKRAATNMQTVFSFPIFHVLTVTINVEIPASNVKVRIYEIAQQFYLGNKN